MTSPNESKKSWWETLPGVLAGMAALVGAIGGLYAVIPEKRATDQNAPIAAQATKPVITPLTDTKPDPCKLPFKNRPISCLGDKTDE